MHVRILPFGILKESLGSDPFALDLPRGATVADLLARLGAACARDRNTGHRRQRQRRVRQAAADFRDGDEVGLLPPVTGGARRTTSKVKCRLSCALTHEPIDAHNLVSAAKHGEDGAVVVFDGIVRNNSRGRRTLHLDYEAYEEMALKQMDELAARRHPIRASATSPSSIASAACRLAKPAC